jgi:predicted nucleic acid-binding protein
MISTVARLLAFDVPHTRFLGPDAAAALLDELHLAGIAGGAVDDALVGAVAREHGVALATRDRRALDTYRALAVEIELVG